MEKTNENEVVAFPFQVKEWEELEGIETVKQARFFAAKALNQATLGLCELPEEIKESIQEVNRISINWGLPPLEGDF